MAISEKFEPARPMTRALLKLLSARFPFCNLVSAMNAQIVTPDPEVLVGQAIGRYADFYWSSSLIGADNESPTFRIACELHSGNERADERPIHGTKFSEDHEHCSPPRMTKKGDTVFAPPSPCWRFSPSPYRDRQPTTGQPMT